MALPYVVIGERQEIRHRCPACHETQWVAMFQWFRQWRYIDENDIECPDCGVVMELDE